MKRPAAVAATAVALVSLFVVLRLAASGWEPSSFVFAGDAFSDPDRVPEVLRVREGQSGYDGQFFFRLALDPLSSERIAHGIELDLPPYRHQRILYPVLAWLAAGGGRPDIVIWALIAINVLAVGVAGFFGAVAAGLAGRSAWWGMVFALLPGSLFAVALDTTEVVALAALLGGIVALRLERWLFAALAMTAASLARETSLIVPAAVLVATAATFRPLRRPVPPALFAAAAPVVVVVAWQVILSVRWGALPSEGAGSTLGPPFLGFIDRTVFRLTHFSEMNLFLLIESGLLWLLLIYGALVLRAPRSPVSAKLMFGFGVTLVVCLSSDVWGRDAGFMRASLVPVALAVLVLLDHPRARLGSIGLATAVTAALNAVLLVYLV